MIMVRFQRGQGIFPSSKAPRPVVGPNSSLIQRVIGTFSLGSNRAGREADFSTPSSVEIQNERICTSILLLSKRHQILHRVKFIFTFPFYCCICRRRRCCCCSIYSEPNSLSRSRWPRGLRRGSAAPCLPGLGVQIPSEAWMPLSYECCVLSGRGLIQRSPTECGVPECDHEASITRTRWSNRKCCATGGGGRGRLPRLDLSLDMRLLIQLCNNC